ILGSVSINLTLMRNNGLPVRLTFSGDIGRPGDDILVGPDAFPQADYIICESTYGDRLHSPKSDSEAQLLEIVQNTCIRNRGRIIIPAFSVGRTQEFVYLLDQLMHEKKLPHINVYVDSPLSVQATAIMNAHKEEFNPEILEYITRDGDAFNFPGLKYISKVEDSKAINTSEEPCIIISASGMAEAGRIKHHIANNISDRKNTILIVGYATPDSLAGRLRGGTEIIRVFGSEHPVLANVEVMDNFSAHADWKEMIQYLSCQNKEGVKEIFLVHGNENALGAWKSRLLNEGFKKVTIAEMLGSIEL
ncbi:MAG: MBL fold metallo-hydrolase, partial [Bacteroidia bacterium]|nr:MBL fold metallo-hydrolase [Bacteroidia bacterium]